MKNLVNKNIICVGTYFNNELKLNITENILEFLFNNKEKINADIMLISKSVVPEKLFKYVDYLIYDKKNELIKTYGESVATTIYDTKYGYKILSNFENTVNTTIPALNIFNSGLVNSLYLGYNNMHFVEYDVEPSKDIIEQLIDNNKILNDDDIDFIIYSDEKDEMVGGFFSLSLNNKEMDFFNKYDPEGIVKEINQRMNNTNMSATCEKIVLYHIQKYTKKIHTKKYQEIKHFHNKVSHKTKILSTLYYDEINNTYGIFIANISTDNIVIKTFECFLNKNKIFHKEGINLNVNDWAEYYNVIKEIPLNEECELIFKINDSVFANYKFDSKESITKFFKKNKKIYE